MALSFISVPDVVLLILMMLIKYANESIVK